MARAGTSRAGTSQSQPRQSQRRNNRGLPDDDDDESMGSDREDEPNDAAANVRRDPTFMHCQRTNDIAFVIFPDTAA